MNPQSDYKRIKLIQLTTTVFLVLILGIMIAAYIYYGMWSAKQSELVAPMVEPEITNSNSTMDEAMRQEIINDLNLEMEPLSEEERKAIVDDLNIPSNQQLSPEQEVRRQETLNQLQQN